MAQLQPFLSFTPFSGSEKDNFTQFERQLRSCIGLAAIDEDQQHRYLHLHLKGIALVFCDQLTEAIREDLDQALDALRNRYVNPDRIELYKLQFQNRKLKQSEESIHDFLTELQRLASLAFPNIAARAAAAGVPAVAAEDRSNERVRRVKENFINGLPNKLKKYLLTLPDHTTVEDLCERASRRAMLEEQYPEDDVGTAFSEISASQMTSLTQSMSALNKNQTELKETTDNLAKSLEEHKIQNANSNAPYSNFRQPHHFYRGRGGFYPRQRFNPPYQFNQNWQMQQPFQQRSRHQNNQSHNLISSQRPGYITTGQQQPVYQAYGYQSHGQQSATTDEAGVQAQGYPASGYPTAYAGHWSNTMPIRNQRYCRNCGKYGHTVQYCWSKPQPERNQQLSFDQQKN